jgi:hypothetical protein
VEDAGLKPETQFLSFYQPIAKLNKNAVYIIKTKEIEHDYPLDDEE